MRVGDCGEVVVIVGPGADADHQTRTRARTGEEVVGGVTDRSDGGHIVDLEAEDGREQQIGEGAASSRVAG